MNCPTCTGEMLCLAVDNRRRDFTHSVAWCPRCGSVDLRHWSTGRSEVRTPELVGLVRDVQASTTSIAGSLRYAVRKWPWLALCNLLNLKPSADNPRGRPDMGQAAAAKRLGIPLEEYLAHRQKGERWCRACAAWLPGEQFTGDQSLCHEHRNWRRSKRPVTGG